MSRPRLHPPPRSEPRTETQSTRESSAATDIVIDALVRHAARLTGASGAICCLVEDDRLTLKSSVGDGDQRCPGLSAFCWEVVNTGEPIVIENAPNDPRARAFLGPGEHRRQRVAPIGFFAGVPLRSSLEIVHGAISVVGDEPRAIGPEIVQQLEALAEGVATLRDSRFLNVYRLVESSPVGVVTADADGTIVLVNRELERIFGYQREELLGQSVEVLIPQSLRPGHVTHRKAFSRAPESRRMGHGRVLTGCTKGGDEVQVEIGLSPIRTRNGLFIHAVVVDVTERVRSENEQQRLTTELEKKTLELEQFVYSASHDLKSPILTIEGFAGYLLRDLEAGRLDRVADFTQRIRSASARIRQNVDDLLEISRVGRTDPPSAGISPTRIATEVIEESRIQFDQVGATVEIQPDIPPVLSSEIRVRQAIQNLLGNALAHGQPASGRLRVRLSGERRGDRVVITVADNGTGVPSEYRERIFGLFERLDPDSAGTGVGLALVKRIADMNGGRVWVDDAPGGGAAFHLELPCAGATPASAYADLVKGGKEETR